MYLFYDRKFYITSAFNFRLMCYALICWTAGILSPDVWAFYVGLSIYSLYNFKFLLRVEGIEQIHFLHFYFKKNYSDVLSKMDDVYGKNHYFLENYIDSLNDELNLDFIYNSKRSKDYNLNNFMKTLENNPDKMSLYIL